MKPRAVGRAGLRLYWPVALLWVAAASGCFAPASIPEAFPGAKPVAFPAPRLQFSGFSVLPPQGEGWYQLPDGETCVGEWWSKECHISFAKLVGSGRMPVSVDVEGGPKEAIVGLPWFKRMDLGGGLKAHLDGVESAIQADADKAGFRITSLKLEADQRLAADCLRTHEKAEFLQTPGVSAINSGLICLHPERPTYLVLMHCAQMFQTSVGPDQAVTHECQAFTDSLAFTTKK